jgi:hypothetical protein
MTIHLFGEQHSAQRQSAVHRPIPSGLRLTLL